MTESLVYTGALTVMTCWCGARHAVPLELANLQERQHNNGLEVRTIYCPLGHEHRPAGEARVVLLKRERESARNEAAARAAERDQAEASARAHKGAATRARKRSAAAVCPCCHRSFVQLRRHMKAKHPEYDPARAEA